MSFLQASSEGCGQMKGNPHSFQAKASSLSLFVKGEEEGTLTVGDGGLSWTKWGGEERQRAQEGVRLQTPGKWHCPGRGSGSLPLRLDLSVSLHLSVPLS